MTLYVSDLDGTLLNNAGKLSPRAADMLNGMTGGGTLFSYCTARGLATAGKITERLKLSAPVALMNGVFIYDPLTGEYPVRNIFGAEQAALLKQAILENEETPMVFAVIDGRERVSYIKDGQDYRLVCAEVSRWYDKMLQLRSVEANIISSTTEGLLIPSEAIATNGENYGVYVQGLDGEYSFRTIEVLIEGPENTLIASGGQVKLYDEVLKDASKYDKK